MYIFFALVSVFFYNFSYEKHSPSAFTRPLCGRSVVCFFTFYRFFLIFIHYFHEWILKGSLGAQRPSFPATRLSACYVVYEPIAFLLFTYKTEFRIAENTGKHTDREECDCRGNMRRKTVRNCTPSRHTCSVLLVTRPLRWRTMNRPFYVTVQFHYLCSKQLLSIRFGLLSITGNRISKIILISVWRVQSAGKSDP